jgi:hypothetical protein
MDDCGEGAWTCSSHSCVCGGTECDGFCDDDATTCCTPGNCGTGEWTCSETHVCTCADTPCGTHCPEPGQCCYPEDCGDTVLWSCTDHECLCNERSCDRSPWCIPWDDCCPNQCEVYERCEFGECV